MIRFLRAFCFLALCAGLAVGAFMLDFTQRFDRVLPRTVLGDLTLSGLSRSQAHEAIKNRLQLFLDTPLYIAARGQAESITLRELSIQISANEVLKDIPFGGPMGNAELFIRSIGGARVIPKTALLGKLTRTEIRRVLDEKFPTIPKARSAHFVKNASAITIEAEKKGLVPNVENLFNLLASRIAFLETSPLFVEFAEETPEVLASDLEAYHDLFMKKMPKTLILTFSDEKKYSWKIDFSAHPEWIMFEKKPYAVAENELPFSLHFDSLAFGDFLESQKIPETLGKSAEDVRMWRDEAGKVQVEGRGINGRAVEKDDLLAYINNALGNEKETVAIPMAAVEAKTDIDPALQELGIRELVSVGYTRFEGSPVNRMHNIGIGVSKYNGLLIAPGEKFSFDDNLGVVDDSTGFRKELVIKPEGTIPEFGGGLCQVSTTMYRAALYAGFPIVDRTPHSYVVSYYAQVGGHGLDATIYPPSRDLKFINDTAAHILIQSYVDGPSAYFKFYGTKDDRVVEMDGPYISNRKSAPTEPIIVPDPKLKPGEKKQIEKAHPGFDALWYRSITKGGKTVKEEIKSHYKAIPDRFLVGGEPKPEGDAPIGEAVNPFE